MNAIISALQDGPKRYNELRSLMCWQLLDIQLDRLCRTREVVISHDRFGRGQFQLPIPPQEEVLVPREYRPEVKSPPKVKPKRKVDGPTKTCSRCLCLRRINQFGRSRSGGNRKNVCYMCVYERRKAVKEMLARNTKEQPLGNCYECREQPAQGERDE